MTTEKEFWNLAGQYFRQELGTSKDEQTIDEGCVGCAGPCKVVDVAANLQKELDASRSLVASYSKGKDRVKERLKAEEGEVARLRFIITREHGEAVKLREELDSTMVKLIDSRNRCDYLSSTIEELKDSNIEDLHELYDLYEAELRGLKVDRTSIKSDRDIMFQNYRNTVAKLQDDIRGLEAELSVCRDDSAVLGKVVEAIRDLQNLTGMVTTYDMRHIRDMVQDYLNAPEGPPETPIDDLYKVTVTYAFLEMP